MGIFTRDRPAPPRRTIVASGKAISVDDREQIARFRSRTAQQYWQARAGVYNDSLPILGFCHDYVRDALSRVRPIAAIESDDPQAPPVPLSKDTAPPGLDPELCDSILQRLAPFPEYMGQTAHRLDIYGECFVAMVEDDVDGDGEEHCRVFSPLEVYTQGDTWRWKRDPGDQNGVAFKVGAPFWRMWQPHPEFWVLPYSHMIRLLLPSKELLLLSQLVASIATSRMGTTGKMLAIADEFSLESPTPDGESSTEDAGDGEALSDSFIDDFMAAASAAISDPESAAAALPLIIRGPLNLIKDGVNVIDIERTFEETLLKLRQEAREEIATGVNLPREIPLGVGSTNHWNAEAIKYDAWLNHLEPRAMSVTSSTTTAFYRPALLANGVDPAIVRRCVVGYDPTWFLGTPDRSEGADQGLADFAISLATWREAKGFTEDDAPDDAEVQMRIGWRQQEAVHTAIREDAGPGPEVQVVNPAGPTTVEKVDVPTAEDKSAPPLAASARSSKLDRLGPKLVTIERDLRTRLHAATEATVTHVLERAGMKARTEVKRFADRSSRTVRDQHKALLAQLDAVPKEGIVAALGAPTVSSYGLNEDQLLQGSLSSLEAKYHALVARAQLAAARAAAEAADEDIDEDALDEATRESRGAGWAVLATGILALSRNLLYDPHPQAPPVGEFDESTVVPIGLVRVALDRAGGAALGSVGRGGVIPTVAPSRSTGPGGPPGGGGAVQGPTMLDEFKSQLGIAEDKYTWVYGDEPRRTFQPHLDLDGKDFTSWDDDVLTNDQDWPETPWFSPQDHPGCCCDYLVTFTQEPLTAADFEEDKHPRDDHGKFSPGDGGDAKAPEAPRLPSPKEPAARGAAVGHLMKAEVKAGHDTQSLHDKIDGHVGVYTDERQALHDDIVRAELQRQIDEGAQKGDTAIILSGLPGAGKSESFDRVVNDKGVITISPDTMKEHLAERGLTNAPAGVGAMEASPLAHEESSDMAKQLAKEATDQGYNIVHDITGSSAASIASRVEQARAAGYKVTGVFVDAPIDQALAHASGRYERGLARDPEAARYTPPENITRMADPTGTYDSLNRAHFEQTKDSMDGWVLIDNSGSEPVVSDTSPGVLVGGKIPL